MENGQLRFKMSIRLFNQEKAFGPGIARLLELTDELKSLNKAAAAMEMAYSKAWKILNDSEKALDFKLLERRAGGSGGGGASLTLEGAQMLKKYREFTEEAQKEVGRIFDKYF